MKKDGYNLSMSEILSSIRSDIFSDQNGYRTYNSYDNRSYNTNEINMSFSDNDNSSNDSESSENTMDDDILELDDSFLDSEEEEFELSDRVKVSNEVETNFSIPISNRKAKPNDIKTQKNKKNSDKKIQDISSEDVDQFLKLIEENDSELQFQNHTEEDAVKEISEENLTVDEVKESDNDILKALSKADELIQKSSITEHKETSKQTVSSSRNKIEKNKLTDNSVSNNITNNTYKNLSQTKNNTENITMDTTKQPIIQDATIDDSVSSIMSESAKQASMRSIHKIIATQKKLQNEKRQTIDELAMAALIPMLQDWMDKNLAKIVEKVVEREISKLINNDN